MGLLYPERSQNLPTENELLLYAYPISSMASSSMPK